MQTYAQWKHWDANQFAAPSPGMEFFFERLAKRYRLPLGRVCEVGFGNGELLGILARHSAAVTGIEQIEGLVETARTELGVESIRAEQGFWSADSTHRQFDLVIGLNVLEHLAFEELQAFFSWFSRSLKPGGLALFQFPEGASPLSVGNFNGDFTHRSWLTRGKVEHLIIGLDLKIVAYDVEPVFSQGLARSTIGRALLLALDKIRVAYSILLHLLAWPIAGNVLFRGNSILVLRRPGA